MRFKEDFWGKSSESTFSTSMANPAVSTLFSTEQGLANSFTRHPLKAKQLCTFLGGLEDFCTFVLFYIKVQGFCERCTFYLKACTASLSPYKKNGRVWNQPKLQTESPLFHSISAFVLCPLTHFF